MSKKRWRPSNVSSPSIRRRAGALSARASHRRGINDDGQIVANAVHTATGKDDGLLLSPN